MSINKGSSGGNTFLSGGNETEVSSSNPLPVVLTGGSMTIGTVDIDQTTPGVTNGVVPIAPISQGRTGQAKIVTTGTAVQLSVVSQALQNGMILSYTSVTGTGKGTYGYANTVTNTTDGTGNGKIILSGASSPVNPGVNLNTIYVNGTLGDIFDWEAN